APAGPYRGAAGAEEPCSSPGAASFTGLDSCLRQWGPVPRGDPMKMRQLGGALFLMLYTGLLLAAAPAAPQKVTEVEGISEYRLANGLRVLLFPDQSKPTVTVNVTYLVGSRHEGYGESGMAHLLEHLLFKGTRNIPDIAKEFNGRGMRWNGTTSMDRTNYYEMFQASEENLEWALRMEADRMVNALVRREDLDTEMTVVRNE